MMKSVFDANYITHMRANPELFFARGDPPDAVAPPCMTLGLLVEANPILDKRHFVLKALLPIIAVLLELAERSGSLEIRNLYQACGEWVG
jgi:hypothetical protein